MLGVLEVSGKAPDYKVVIKKAGVGYYYDGIKEIGGTKM